MRFEALKDGMPVLIREPTRGDVDRMRRFFLTLSPDDRRYLRFDVTKPGMVERMLEQVERGDGYRLIALADDQVVASGLLELSGEGWRRHMGEIRVIIAPAYRRRRLGTTLIRDLFEEAERREVERVDVKLAESQVGARKICERLGFRTDAVLPGHIKDSRGDLQSMVIMSCTLDDMWKELKDFYDQGDWPDG